MKQIRALIRNYVWAGKSTSRTRAKVAWQQAILPLDRGGLKLLDPEIQASALLVKLLTRGLTLGVEPWKEFIIHRVESCQQVKRSRWPRSSQWLMTTEKIHKTGSAFWLGTWKSWKEIRKGITQIQPQHWVEIIRQPLFGNNLIRNSQGIMLGMMQNGKLRNWAQKRITKTLDVWDAETRVWRTSRDLNSTLRTSKIESQRLEVTSSIPWNLGAIPQQIQVGEWLADISALPPSRIVHIHSIREGEL